MPDYTGSIQLDGKSHTISVSGSPSGRIMIRIGANTVYDKKPFIAKQSVSFTVSGGTGTLTWQNLGLGNLECDISIDGKTTTLSRIDKHGRVTPPLDPISRARAQIRVYGILFVAAGLFAVLLNYFELRTGRYYPSALTVAPALVFMGIFFIVKRPVVKELSSKYVTRILLIGVPLMLLVGWAFSKWFLLTFAPQ
jgi:hypothetical protein